TDNRGDARATPRALSLLRPHPAVRITTCGNGCRHRRSHRHAAGPTDDWAAGNHRGDGSPEWLYPLPDRPKKLGSPDFPAFPAADPGCAGTAPCTYRI